MNTQRNWLSTLSAPDPIKRRGPYKKRALEPDPMVNVPSGFSIGDTATMGEMLMGMRLRADLTQGELADRLGTNSRTIRRLERCEQIPRLTEIEDWAHVCGFSVVVGVEG